MCGVERGLVASLYCSRFHIVTYMTESPEGRPKTVNVSTRLTKVESEEERRD